MSLGLHRLQFAECKDCRHAKGHACEVLPHSLVAHKGLADSQGLQRLQTTNDKDYKDLQAYQATTEKQYFSQNWYQV